MQMFKPHLRKTLEDAGDAQVIMGGYCHAISAQLAREIAEKSYPKDFDIVTWISVGLVRYEDKRLPPRIVQVSPSLSLTETCLVIRVLDRVLMVL